MLVKQHLHGGGIKLLGTKQDCSKYFRVTEPDIVLNAKLLNPLARGPEIETQLV
jgi:hypothetical protein